MNQLIIVRGLPGSGKSTYAQNYAKEHNYKHFESDMFFIDDGEYRFDITKLKEAHTWCRLQVEDHLEKGYDVIVSNTFTKLWEILPYLSTNANIKIVECTGKFGNKHNVPLDVLEAMASRFDPKEAVLLECSVDVEYVVI